MSQRESQTDSKGRYQAIQNDLKRFEAILRDSMGVEGIQKDF